MSSTAAASYDAVAKSRSGDLSSKDVPFRHFNNYVKKYLIQYALDGLRASQLSMKSISVLDLASGRGGDVGKWLFMQSPPVQSKASDALRISQYECYDISPDSISEAKGRYQKMKGQSQCTANFYVADCFSDVFLSTDLPTNPFYGKFGVVSIQFALHYACFSKERVQELLEVIAQSLDTNGFFIATTVNPYELSSRVKTGSLSNSLFNVELLASPVWDSDSDALLAAGTKYQFKLDGFVDCPEYLVPLDYIRTVAPSLGLRECTDASKPFGDFLVTYSSDRRINKGNVLSADERALSTLYYSLCFQKI
ncbi:mRNA (guanine-N7-)-methyltransferase [Strigomonas culicis]|uniref:mRNA (guanine-N(7))-methyltransferase n=2 Tax=Strigomonas culicis TaxID=28005 RepID=S9VMY5_9TRYP|nr:mRNA (guanine-N7-)-methyltransferase [Strigomonas culicis]|eukprot:EPY28546.1 mRNA (guanine-N7-)-methyltransferase [Strigomonas culicis]